MSNYLTSTQSDTRYYTKSDIDANYPTFVYTANTYQVKGTYAAASELLAVAADVTTLKRQLDIPNVYPSTLYSEFGNYYTKTASDTRF